MCYGRIDCPNRPLITQTLGVVPEQVGLGFLKGVRAGVGVLGKVFGLPTSTVGDALLEKVQSALGVVGAGHVDYMCVTEAASEYANSSGPVSQQQLSQFQEHEFGEFLKEYDPREEWRKELTRVALKQTGKVLWVCADALGQLEDEGQLTQPPPPLPLGDYGASGTRKILCSCVAWMVIATLSSYVADCGLAGCMSMHDALQLPLRQNSCLVQCRTLRRSPLRLPPPVRRRSTKCGKCIWLTHSRHRSCRCRQH
jgi:hypothetical protein